MGFPKLDIKLENEKNSFIIEEKEVSKIYLVFPFFNDAVTSQLLENDNKLVLNVYDQIASSCLGNKNYMNSFYSFSPLSKTVRIIVPKNSLYNLDINLENGNLFLKTVNLQNAKISCLRGNVKIENSNINNVSVDSYKSNISIKNLEGSECFIKTKTGNLELEGSYPDFISLKTILGNIKLTSKKSDLKHTLVDIDSKKIKQSVRPTREFQKVIRCIAPHGYIDSDVF